MRFANRRTQPLHRLVSGGGGVIAVALAAAVFPMLTLSILSSPAVAADQVLHCGVDILLEKDLGELPPEGLQFMDPVERKRKAATINLNAGAGLLANADALTAWQNAVAKWESILNDTVTITIDGDLAALGPGILGSTSSRSFFAGYTTVRDAVVADRAADEGFIAQMPTAAQFNTLVPPGMSYSGNISATKANLRALGFDMSFDDPNPDATIIFSTGFEPDFDYDPTDGITTGQFDFEGIVLHEIGHALGFVSEVDWADYLVDQGATAALDPSTLDLFRTAPGTGAVNFTTATRTITPGSLLATQTTYEGNVDLGMSTGSFTGDGRQASHWKANELSGTYIGAMDPTLARGELTVVTVNDKRAFGIIGWDVTLGPVNDCNNNGVEDSEDISSGTSQDCNTNGIPDECDIADGTSQDCNTNGVPDECDIAVGTSQDCNTNGVPDECDIALGTSQDCNTNGIPDECETDCNSNGVPDDCDITAGTSQDCNTNGVPDECDIAVGTSQDCNTNGIPDECETDCNSNGVPDDCDITAGTSQDCNTNGVPDECDIALGTSDDLNTNGIPDECEGDCNENGVPDDLDISGGTSQDCNGNQVPDECDIASGTSEDCNTNGVPDDCDITSGTSTDLNGNSVPDECEYTGVDESPGRLTFQMAAYPNPFNPMTTIYYELPTSQHVRMLVYDVTGRLVRTLVDAEITAGPHTVMWQGHDDKGAQVASGVYFLAYQTREETLRRKLTLVK